MVMDRHPGDDVTAIPVHHYRQIAAPALHPDEGNIGTPYLGLECSRYLPVLGGSILLLVVEWLQREKEYFLQIANFPLVARWLIYYLCILVILIFGAFGSNEFIYTQF
jgi:hypothetical protein